MATSRLNQSVDARLQEIREFVRSGATEMVGKTKRGASGKVEGRYKGGATIMFPELAVMRSPGEAAKAIGRGKGKVYNRLRREVIRQLAPHFPKQRIRAPEKPSVSPHPKLTRKCKLCKVAHGKGQHRFHGQGSFHSTHAFGFNPPENPELFKKFLTSLGYLPEALRPDLMAQLWNDKKLRKRFEEWKKRQRQPSLFGGGPMFTNPRAKKLLAIPKEHQTGAYRGYSLGRTMTGELYVEKGGHLIGWASSMDDARRKIDALLNPRKKSIRKKPTKNTVIYRRVLRIEAQKVGPHRCDAECRRFKHKYFHDFRLRNVQMFGLPNGDLLIKTVGAK